MRYACLQSNRILRTASFFMPGFDDELFTNGPSPVRGFVKKKNKNYPKKFFNRDYTRPARSKCDKMTTFLLRYFNRLFSVRPIIMFFFLIPSSRFALCHYTINNIFPFFFSRPHSRTVRDFTLASPVKRVSPPHFIKTLITYGSHVGTLFVSW